jgi:hypothetical protein
MERNFSKHFPLLTMEERELLVARLQIEHNMPNLHVGTLPFVRLATIEHALHLVRLREFRFSARGLNLYRSIWRKINPNGPVFLRSDCEY